MLALVLREPHAETVNALLDRWEGDGVELHAPLLAQYEVASGLTRRRARGEFSRKDVGEALRLIADHEVIFHSAGDLGRIVEIAAVGLERHKAYDASYLALAEELDAEVWTLDGPLARNAGDRFRVTLVE
jgi:predicted nucleic acid-binding protein